MEQPCKWGEFAIYGNQVNQRKKQPQMVAYDFFVKMNLNLDVPFP